MLTTPLRLARAPARTLTATVQLRSFTASSLLKKSFPALVQEIKANNKAIHHITPRDLRAISSIPHPSSSKSSSKPAAGTPTSKPGSKPASKPSNASTIAGNPRLPPHVIDVRERHEVEATGTIPGAIVLPRGVLERDIGKFIKQEDPRDVVVYCAGGMRSVLAAESLIRLGYGSEAAGPISHDDDAAHVMNSKNKSKVWSLDEGMDGWIKNGFEVEKKAL